MAVGVGFLLNSTSRVISWSCVALCRFWFFCCWVKVLFRGGLRDEEVPVVADAGGEGVEDMLSPRSMCCITVAINFPSPQADKGRDRVNEVCLRAVYRGSGEAPSLEDGFRV